MRTRGPLLAALGARGSAVTLALLVATAILVPVLHLAVPEGSALHMSSFAVSLLGKYLAYALLALAVDLIWGYCGILSLGHGAFFALGGYAMGMYLMREIGSRGVYGNPLLPDFMVFLNWKSLPWYWHGFDHFAFAALMVLVVPGLLAFVFGWFAFRSRVTGVYLSIITQAMTYALMLSFFRNDMGFGGNNGLTDFKDLLGFNLQSEATRAGLFAATAAFLALGFVICRLIVASKLGRVLVAIRDAEGRTRFLGYRVERYKLFVFVVSAMLAGVAGALYVPQVGIINPSEFAPANSIEIVVWVALGGRGTLYGAIIGAIAGEPRQELSHRRHARGVAVRARRAVHRRHAVPAARHCRAAVGQRAGPWARARPAGADRGGRRPHGAGQAMTAAAETMLYLDGVSVSLRRVQGAQRAQLLRAGERDARHHRAERRRQDDHDGRGHRQDPAGRGQRSVPRLDRPHAARRGRHRQPRHRPQVPEADGVRQPDRLPEPGARTQGAARRVRHPVRPADRRRARPHRSGARYYRTDSEPRRAGGSLSHGQKQWLEIGMLLMQEPELLLVDEPVAGMTDAETAATADLLREVARTRSVVVVEHDMEFVRSLGCRVTVLHEGAVLAEGALETVQADPRVIEVYLGR